MNILFIVDTFPTLSETFIVNQILDFKDKGHKVYIYSINRPIQYRVTNILIENLKENIIYYQKSKSKKERYAYFINFLYRCPLKYKLKFFENPIKYYVDPVLFIENEIDVIHCHFAPNAVWFYNKYIIKGFFKTAKKICTFHGYDMAPNEIELNRIKYKDIFKSFNLFTYNTSYLGELIKKCDSEIKLFQNPVGINTNYLSRFKNEVVGKGLFSLIFVGRLIPLKGVMLLPQIMHRIIKKNVNINLYIIGNGECYNELEEEISRLNLSNHIFLKGERNQDEVFNLMSKSHVFLFPGIEDEISKRAETQGLVVQESQFFGLPVIVSDAGGSKYGLIDGKTGIVVKMNDVNGYVEAILNLYNDKKMYKSMRRDAQQFVVENYDISFLNNQLLDAYKKL